MGQATSSEVKDETPIRYAHSEIRTRMVIICGPTCYQLDHGGALSLVEILNYIEHRVMTYWYSEIRIWIWYMTRPISAPLYFKVLIMATAMPSFYWFLCVISVVFVIIIIPVTLGICLLKHKVVFH